MNKRNPLQMSIKLRTIYLSYSFQHSPPYDLGKKACASGPDSITQQEINKKTLFLWQPHLSVLLYIYNALYSLTCCHSSISPELHRGWVQGCVITRRGASVARQLQWVKMLDWAFHESSTYF